MKHYLETIDGEIKTLINRCYSGYNGSKIALSDDIPSELNSYWDGGSKSSYVFYHLDTKQTVAMPQNHPVFNSDIPNKTGNMPERVIIVEHRYFCGKDMGITIYANKTDLTPLLPKSEDISEHQRIVLKYTSMLKNTDGGRSNIRFIEAHRETGISVDQWKEAKQILTNKKMLRNNGSITPAGRNALNSSN